MVRKKLTAVLSFLLIISTLAIAVDNPIVTRSEEEEFADPRIQTIQTKKRNDDYVQLHPNIVYSKLKKNELKLHLLIPNHNEKPMPLILYIKGSSWGKYNPQDTFSYIPQLVQFAKNGYVVASVEHRTSHEAKFPAQLQDVKTAVRFLKSHADQYNIDVNHVGVWGTSSGGHLAALLGTSGGVAELDVEKNNLEMSRVQAVVDWYGPTDFLQMSIFPEKYNANDSRSAESLVIGGPIQKNKGKVKRANPITYITPDDPPFLIMHGDRDERVPFHQSELLYEALKKANIDVSLYKIKGGGHGSGFAQQEILNTVQAFFDRHLKN